MRRMLLIPDIRDLSKRTADRIATDGNTSFTQELSRRLDILQELHGSFGHRLKGRTKRLVKLMKLHSMISDLNQKLAS